MGSFVVTLREGFEAALIVGIILAFLDKTGTREAHERAVWWGVGLAIALSVGIGGLLFATVGEIEGTGEAVYEGVAMLLAAAFVTWMVFWMRRQAATIGSHLRDQVSASISSGGGFALASVAFIGVGREGLETALFLFASAEDSGPVLAVSAAVAGLVAAVALGVLFYRGTLRLDLARFFTITSILVIAFAAYLIYGGLHELGEAAESEFLELAAPIAALLYAGGFALVYLKGWRVTRERTARADTAAEAEPA
jgi:high-affinity iron transporter